MHAKELADLSTIYNQSHRKYHNINHIMFSLAELEKYKKFNDLTESDLQILEWAIWYHDAVYNPYSSTNEEASADLLGASVLQYREHVVVTHVQRAQIAIAATKHHTITQNVYNDLLTQVMLDIDLAGLGSRPHIYAKNSLDIRDEYFNTTDREFLKGRQSFLTTMLMRADIYYTQHFRSLYASAAQRNMTKELELVERSLAEAVDYATWRRPSYFEVLQKCIDEQNIR
jgi:predicted metal-dependent HD superfamily phosphohydrolase